MHVYYTIYKITNKINNKTYIGKHQTKNINDNYMGSGKLLKRSIQKYGIKNFTKEILHIFDNEEDMNNKEKELVVINEDSYNLCNGGHGGFSYINRTKLGDKRSAGKKGRQVSDKILQEKYGDKWRNEIGKLGGINCQSTYSTSSLLRQARRNQAILSLQSALTIEAINKRKETYKKIKFQQGKNNSQFGTCWITNGLENKKIKLEDLSKYEANGYYRGMTSIK